MTAPAGLLSAVADALNACERAGIAVDTSHGAILTAFGYVLPAGDARLGMRWTVRTRTDPDAAPCREIEEAAREPA